MVCWPGGAPISAQDGVTVRLDPSGSVACNAGVTEQGQGTDVVIKITKRVASSLGRQLAQPIKITVIVCEVMQEPMRGLALLR